MSEISTDKITPRIKSATKITQIDSTSKFPAGMVLNIVSSSKTDIQTCS